MYYHKITEYGIKCCMHAHHVAPHAPSSRGELYRRKTLFVDGFPIFFYPNGTWTHPPTSKLFLDFWNFFNFAKPLIDTGASINMLPVKYAKYGTEPYSGVLEDKPTGTCRMKVTNPRNGKKYSVPFVVFEGDRLPILSYRTSLQMKLITVEKGNFDMVAGVAT